MTRTVQRLTGIRESLGRAGDKMQQLVEAVVTSETRTEAVHETSETRAEAVHERSKRNAIQ